MRAFITPAVVMALATSACGWENGGDVSTTGVTIHTNSYTVSPKDGVFHLVASPGDTLELSVTLVGYGPDTTTTNVAVHWNVQGLGGALLDSVTYSSAGGIATNRLVLGDFPYGVLATASVNGSSATFTVQERPKGGG